MRSGAGRVLAVILGGAAILVIVLSVAGASSGGETPPGASSLDDSSRGLSKWASILELRGHDVERRLDSASSADLDADETAILLDAGDLSEIDERALATFLDRGGRLVIGGELAPGILRRLADTSLGVTTTTSPVAPLVPVAETRGVNRVSGSAVLYETSGDALPVLGLAKGQALLLTASIGEDGGQLLLLSDSDPLVNGEISEDDNARLAANLGGDPARPVVFIEDVGNQADTGLAALPGSWGWAALLLLVAAFTLIASYARRFGPPDQPHRELPPPRREYVDAVGGSLARTKASYRAAEPLRDAALERLRAMAGSDAPSADMLARIGADAGLTAEEMRALSEPLSDDDDAVLTGRALSKLWR